MSKMPLFFLFILFLYLNLNSQTLPFYSKADLWYRSNELDSSKQEWSEISRNQLSASSSKNFHLCDSSYNFHPSIHFEDSTDVLKTIYPVTQVQRLTVISVFNIEDTLTEQGIWSLVIAGKQLTALTDRQLIREKSSYEYPVRKKGIPIINTSVQSFSKKRGDTIEFIIGNCELSDSTKAYFVGNMAECMVFDRFLKKAELLRIESYLALKYGITLYHSNYVSPCDTIIWNYDTNYLYSHSIAGIGKDSVFGLHQRQSQSVESNGLLTIGKGSFSALNRNNTDTLAEGSYLIWGDNNESLSCENPLDSIPLWERKWLMQVTKANTIPTNIRLKIPYQSSDSSYYLVIDRSGTGNFDSLHTETIPKSYQDSNGYVYFTNIKWDTDSSGKDIFTFSPGQIIIQSMSVFIPDTSCHNLGLEEEYQIEKGESRVLECKEECVKPLHYQWSKNGQLINEEKSIVVNEEGEYSLTVIMEDGSQQAGHTTVKYTNTTITNEFCEYKVYPNPSKGMYTVEVKLLEPSDITIRTYTVSGSLIQEQKDKGKKFYKFDGYLDTQGYYFIDIETTFEKQTIKIAITK